MLKRETCSYLYMTHAISSSSMFLTLVHLANLANLQECLPNHQGCTKPPGSCILSSLALPLPSTSILLFSTSPLPTLEHVKKKCSCIWLSGAIHCFSFSLICPSLPCALTQIEEEIACWLRSNTLAALCLLGSAHRERCIGEYIFIYSVLRIII